MKARHNKKRNSAVLFEVLVREFAKSAIKKDTKRKEIVLSLMKEHFKSGTLLAKELEHYKTLCETTDLHLHTADKLLQEVRYENTSLDREKLFEEQSDLIKKINRHLSPNVFSNFIPNYKNLATIYQILNSSVASKKRLVLEQGLLSKMTSNTETLSGPDSEDAVDDVIYRSFVKKFNSQYNELLEEQRQLLNNYILSFSDNGLMFKVFLNEELGRLKDTLRKANAVKEISEDELMSNKTKEILSMLTGYEKGTLDEKKIVNLLKIQSLVNEIQS